MNVQSLKTLLIKFKIYHRFKINVQLHGTFDIFVVYLSF